MEPWGGGSPRSQADAHLHTDMMIPGIRELSGAWAESDLEISNYRGSRNTRQRQRRAEVGSVLSGGEGETGQQKKKKKEFSTKDS